jgi:catechol 2,3-dioxygenase-like lactoylglutathione lyase family enzyme
VVAFIIHVTFDCVDPRRVADFWAAVTGYSIVDARDEFVRLRAPDQRGVRHLLFFKVPEPKTCKNRMHVDLATKEPVSEIERLIELGATMAEPPGSEGLPWRSAGGARWIVMRDPEGNEFCIG